MRIALQSPALSVGPDAPSGAAAATEALAGALRIAGHQVDPVGAIGTAKDAADQLAERLAAEAGRPDIWLTYGLRPGLPDPVGPQVARTLDIPYVLVDPRDPEPVTADGVIALSDASAHWTATHLPEVPASRLLPFIDPGPYDSLRRQHGHQAAALAMRHALDTDAPRLLFVGAMEPGDNLESCRLMVRAISRLATIPYQLVVIGDGSARAEVEAELRRLPLGRVRSIGGLPHEEVIPFYAMSDLLVAPCVGGTHGRVLLEAQATGLPVIAGDAPGVRDAVHDGMTGRLTPAGNAESIAQAIAFLLRERQFLNSLALVTHKTISKEHHIASAAAALDGFLTPLVTG